MHPLVPAPVIAGFPVFKMLQAGVCPSTVFRLRFLLFLRPNAVDGCEIRFSHHRSKKLNGFKGFPEVNTEVSKWCRSSSLHPNTFVPLASDLLPTTTVSGGKLLVGNEHLLFFFFGGGGFN